MSEDIFKNPLSLFDVRGKTAVVTGATGAFGALAAKLLAGAAAGQEMREADGELLRPAGIEAEQTQRGIAAMIGRLVRFGFAEMFDFHQNFSPFSIR